MVEQREDKETEAVRALRESLDKYRESPEFMQDLKRESRELVEQIKAAGITDPELIENALATFMSNKNEIYGGQPLVEGEFLFPQDSNE